jgi:hypothetical protein
MEFATTLLGVRSTAKVSKKEDEVAPSMELKNLKADRYVT